jgi:hypothetical protein
LLRTIGCVIWFPPEARDFERILPIATVRMGTIRSSLTVRTVYERACPCRP